jgi:methionine-R-sulfoxide reductase
MGVIFLMALAAGATVACAMAGRREVGLPAATEGERVRVSVFNARGELVGPVEMARVVKSDAAWKEQLGTEVYGIARGKGTERAFCGGLLENHEAGVYTCVCCGLPLFSSDAKFESGTGWPSFFQPIAPGNVVGLADERHGIVRMEILCGRCGCHLGHVFTDGPKPTGLRFCLNSASMGFTKQAEVGKLAEEGVG